MRLPRSVRRKCLSLEETKCDECRLAALTYLLAWTPNSGTTPCRNLSPATQFYLGKIVLPAKDFYMGWFQNLASMLRDTSELPNGIRRTSSPLRHFRRTDRVSLIRFLRPPIAREPFRHRELRRSQTRGNALVSGSRPVAMDAA